MRAADATGAAVLAWLSGGPTPSVADNAEPDQAWLDMEVCRDPTEYARDKQGG